MTNNDYVESLDIFKAYELVVADLDTKSRMDKQNIAETYKFFELLYQPHPELKSVIEQYEHSIEDKSKGAAKRRGELLEEVALLAFSGLQIPKEIRSFRSFDSQLDLMISGIEVNGWYLFSRILGLPLGQSMKIILEAKNTGSKIDSQIFSRLGYIIENRHETQCSLGVFFTTEGAAGFPISGKSQISLTAARATQILFHAKTRKSIVVFDRADIRLLVEPGSLVRLLHQKIRDIEDAVGGHDLSKDTKIPQMRFASQLPKHLRKYT